MSPVFPDFDAEGWPTLVSLASAVPAATARLFLDPPRWIRRRVERTEFLGENRVSRHVSLDFALPNVSAFYRSNGLDPVAYVPLALLNKAVLERFDLRDEGGNALSLLSRSENSLISRRMLVGTARAVVNAGLGVDLDPDIAEELRDIVGGDKADALGRVPALNAKALADPDGQVGLIWNVAETAAMLRDLASGFVLYVPLECRPGERRVIKYSHEEEFRREFLPQSSGNPSRSAVREQPRTTWAERVDQRFFALQSQMTDRIGYRWMRLKRELLLEPWRFGFGLSLGSAHSTHIEIPAPDDLLVMKAEIVAANRPGTPRIAGPVSGTELAHLLVGPQPRETAAVLNVDFVLRAGGILSASMLIAMFTTLMLLGGVALHFIADVPVRADAAGAVVVVAPAIFAPFLAVSASHRLVRRVVRMLKGLLMAAALISFAGAASLVASFPHHVRPWIWIGLSVLSLGPTILLVLAWRNARRIEQLGALD